MFTVDEPIYKVDMEQYASNGQIDQLRLREIGKRRQITSANVRVTCNVVLLLPTCGMSIVGLALAILRRRKAQKKYDIIVATMQKHDIKMPKHRKRDTAIPIAVNVGVYLATFGIIWGLDHVFAEAAMYMMPYGYVPMDEVVHVSGPEAAQQFMASPDLFVQGMEQGARGALDFAGAAATQNMNGVIHDLAINATPWGEPLAYVAGEQVGSQAAVEGIRKVAASPFDYMTGVAKKVE
jgi:hypothetical protein